jgi:hypothetical protein
MATIIEKVRKLMARPTTLKPADGGEIVLKGCTKETIESVRALLTKPEATPAKIEEPATVKPPVVPVATVAETPIATEAMPSPGLGMYQNPLTLNWHVCDIRFSPYSKRGIVANDRIVGRDKYEADERFKIDAIRLGLVG